jgi:hypothetical protein
MKPMDEIYDITKEFQHTVSEAKLTSMKYPVPTSTKTLSASSSLPGTYRDAVRGTNIFFPKIIRTTKEKQTKKMLKQVNK